MSISDHHRPSPGQINAYYNPSHNLLHEGVVQSVTVLDRLEGTVVVFLPLTRTYVRATVQAGFKSVNNIGTSNPLVPGDKVLVMHLSGNGSQATIIGYSSWRSKLPNYLNRQDRPIPLPNTLLAGGLAGATIPEWLQSGGAAQCQVYPLITPSKGGLTSTKPGAYDLFTITGDRKEFTLGVKSTFNTQEVKTVLSDTRNVSESLVSKNLIATQALNEMERWCTLPRVSFNADKFDWVGEAPAVAAQEDRQKLNIEYLGFLHEYRDEQFDAMEEQLAEYDKVLDCLEDAAKEVQKKSRSLLDKILPELIKAGTSLALDALNDKLPSDWQVGLDVSVNDNNQTVVKSVKVGDLTYNSESSTVTVNGRLFNLATDTALSKVNKVLPKFLQVSSSELGIVVGELVIPTANLDPEEEQEFPVKEDVVFLNKKGTAYLTVAGNKFSLGGVQDLLEAKLGAESTSQLNEILPDELQVSYSKDLDGHRNVEIGPVSILTEGPKAGLTIDRVKANSILEKAPDKLFNQMGAPGGSLARMLWKPAASKIITALLGKSKEQKKADQDALIAKLKASISKKEDPCGIGSESSIPTTTIQVPTHNTQT